MRHNREQDSLQYSQQYCQNIQVGFHTDVTPLDLNQVERSGHNEPRKRGSKKAKS